jgi:microcystin-dependent protein
MAVKIRRTYKGAAPSASLDSSGVSSTTQTAITLSTSPVNWPIGKFFVVVAPGTAQEEKMCVTLSGSTLTVVDPMVSSLSASTNGRGVDDTTARSTIAAGAAVYPVFTAIDANEANELTSTYAAQGGIVYQGASTFTQLGIGTAGQVMKVNSGATAPEWGQVPTAGIVDNAVTLGKLATALQAFLVPVGTINAYVGATAPTGWLLCDGTSTSGYTSLAALVGATTPDLRGKFLLGKTASGTGSTLLGSGGSNTIAETNLPAHIHSAGTLVNAPAGSHTHTFSGTTSSVASSYYRYEPVGSKTYLVPEFGASDQNPDNAANLPHSHTFSGTTASDGSHTHTISGSTAATGGGTAYFQPFVAVNYIIKHD